MMESGTYYPPTAKCVVCLEFFSFTQRTTPGAISDTPLGPAHRVRCTRKVEDGYADVLKQLDTL